MANRFWVGGSAAWDGTAGTKWATTSGGAGGAAIPTSADAVFFDAASGASTVTISTGNTGAASIDCTGFTGTLAGSGALSVAGSILLVAGLTLSYTGALTLTGSGTLTSAGKTRAGQVTINGSGTTMICADAFTTTSALVLTSGTLDFATNDVQATFGTLSSSGSSARSLTFGATKTNLNLTTTAASGWTTPTATNLTISGLASVTFTNSSTTSFQTINSGTYKVPIVAWQAGHGVSISASATVGTLRFPQTGQVLIAGSASIDAIDTTTNALSASNGGLLNSSSAGTQRTITMTGSPTASFLAVQDIAVSGAILTVSGGVSLGNNSGITFSGGSGGGMLVNPGLSGGMI